MAPIPPSGFGGGARLGSKTAATMVHPACHTSRIDARGVKKQNTLLQFRKCLRQHCCAIQTNPHQLTMAAANSQGVPHGAVQIEAAMRELLVTDTQRSQAARTQLTSALRSQFCAAALIFLVQHSTAIEVSRNGISFSAQCQQGMH